MVAALPKKRKRYIKPDPEQGGHYVRVMPQGANVFAAATLPRWLAQQILCSWRMPFMAFLIALGLRRLSEQR
jgi:hypothetical protein